MLIKRILMNAVDSSPGNGAPAASSSAVQPSQEPAPQAQGAPTANPLEDIVAKLAATVEGVAKSVNSLHAADRRVREGKQSKSDETSANSTTPSVAPAADPMKLRSLDRALAKSGLVQALTDSQYQRAERAFASEDPTDVEAWVADYFAGFSKPTSAAPVAAPVAQQMNQSAGVVTTPAATTMAPEAPRAPVASMPNAPTGPVNPITSGGLVDLFSLTPAQLQQLGPQKVRAELEKIWAVGNATAGAPQRPKAPGR